ncbi:phosphate ABC transporter substrate-binding protein PstS [Flindersiella endophytica]
MNPNRFAKVAALAAIGAITLAACGSDPESTADSGETSSSDSSSSASAEACPSGTINAEGSSAQKNAIEEIIAAYQEKCPDFTANYNPSGSGAGIKQFNAGLVDFGGSDSALKPDEVAAAKKRCGGNDAWNLPMVTGPIAVAYNVQGVDKLVLDADVTAKIFNGTVKTWNDPAIAALNKGVTLPSANISVFFRSDESGTTENFGKYLKGAAPSVWKTEPSKTWEGAGSGKEKSAGVAEGVKSTPNSITYVELSYAKDNQLGIAQIDNGSGPVELTGESAGKAIAAAKAAGQGNDLKLELDYATKEAGAYPIVLVTYEIVCSKGLDATKTAGVKGLLGYFSSTEGQSSLEEIGYAPLPDEMRTKVEAAVKAIR